MVTTFIFSLSASFQDFRSFATVFYCSLASFGTVFYGSLASFGTVFYCSLA